MAYIDRYSEFLSGLAEDIRFCQETGKRAAFGYMSDLDIVFEYDQAAYDRLLADYLREEPSTFEGDMIDSTEALARVTAAYMLQGLGGEIDITDFAVCEYMNAHFKGTPSLGGTGVQAASALAAMGMPLLAELSDRCREVCTLMDYPGLYAVKGDQAVPVMEIAEDETPVYHMIFQYTKDDALTVNGTQHQAPVANRLIMDYDRIHKNLTPHEDFLRYLETHAKNIVSYLISGWNCMTDPKLAKDRMRDISEHYRKIKEANPDCVFYFESAHYLNSAVKDIVYAGLADFLDIMGMNEEELAGHAEELGRPIDKASLPDVIAAMEMIIARYHVRGIILHTKDYSMYYGDELKGADMEKGLTMGNLMSGTRARVGHYGAPEECAENLKLPLSPTGLRFARELDEMKPERYSCLVPSRYMEHPKYTIGLGDTFVAGVQLGFINTGRTEE